MGEWDDQYYIQGSDSLQVQHPVSYYSLLFVKLGTENWL